MVLRIEDTDLERSTRRTSSRSSTRSGGSELDWDEGPISQVAREPRHRAALDRLLESGHAYRDAATADDVRA
jgi:glutamyl-tRNA synthetase